VLLASGVALAATVKGTGGNDYLVGTSSRDVLIPYGGNDETLAYECTYH
jgi:hypothetical protein